MAEVSWRALDGEGPWTVRARAADFLKGIVGTVGEVVDGEEGWTRPLRFTAEQVRALSSCAAWHPALYRAQAASTAGARVEVETSANVVAFEVARGTGAAWTGDEAADVARDGFSVDVDDEHVETVLSGHGTGIVVVDLSAAKPEGSGTAEGGAASHVVRLWLPYLSSCAVRQVLADADVRATERRRLLLVIGDSIAQGEDAYDPGLSWPARLVREAGVDILNQGLLGQVFQPSAVSSLAGAVDPDLVWVALGANYRHEECYAGTVERDVRASLAFMRRQWRDRRIWVATPTAHDESIAPSAAKSCWQALPAILERVCERWPQFSLVDGADLLDDDPECRADADHPNVRGHEQMARRIARVLEGREPLSDEERSERAMPDFLRTLRRPAISSETRGAGRSVPRRPSSAVPLDEPDLESPDAEEVVEPEIELEVEEDVSEVEVAVVEAVPEPEPAIEPDVVEVEEVASPAETTVLSRDAIQAAAARAAEAAERREARRKRTLEEDAEALLEILLEGPIDSVPLEQLLIRGLGTPTFVSEGFCSVDLPNGARCLWGEDVIEARRVLSRQRRPNLVICLSAGLEPMVRRIFPTDAQTLWYTLAVYEGTESLPVESDLLIEPLDNSHAGFISRTYSYPDGINGAELAHMLSHGVVLGGFEPDGELVGYIGEWREGAMGMLEVLPHARRRGYGAALESAKANEHLAQGWTPFAQIMDGNAASLRLQKALGLTLAAERQCYIPMS